MFSIVMRVDELVNFEFVDTHSTVTDAKGLAQAAEIRAPWCSFLSSSLARIIQSISP
jgi:hypothetical protein